MVFYKHEGALIHKAYSTVRHLYDQNDKNYFKDIKLSER